MRCFSFISDVVDPLVRMGSEEASVGEVINIGPDDEFVSINDLASTIARLLDFNLSPQRLDPRPNEVVLANCSADKARRLLGYEAKVGLEEGLIAMIDWIRTRGVRPFVHDHELEITGTLAPRTWTEKLL